MPENDSQKLRPHPFRSPPGASEAVPRPPSPPPPYAELCVTSNYTFLTGASHPEEFVHAAAALGYRAVALTDTHTLAGVVRAHVAAKDADVRFVLGVRLRLRHLDDLSILVYPTDMASYRRLCRMLTTGKRRAKKGECLLDLRDLADHAEDLLAIAVPEGPPDEPFAAAVRLLAAIFDGDRLSIAARLGYAPDDGPTLWRLASLSERTGVPLVATNDAHYHTPDRRPLQDVLTCVRHGCTLAQAGFRLLPNAERHLKPPEEMHRLFKDHPAALARTVEIAERTAGFTLDALKYEYPDEVVPAGKTAMAHLTDLTWAGAAERYPGGVSPKVRAMIEHELRLIEELNYPSYFLTVHDLVRFARSRTPPILCQGRGAAANSAVCYCLGVTAVNPEEISLLFERFLSKERNEPPDIDIDFEHERREEVIQYLYAKYGRDRAALTAEVITYRRRSAVRDVGKALGLSLDLVDRLAKDIEWWDDGGVDDARLRELGLNPADPTLRWLARLTADIVGFPRHLSQHVGGFVITRSPLCELVPVENAAMPNRTVIEWDKDDIDAVGMLKVDVLGLGMLTCLGRALDLVNRRAKGRRDKGQGGGRTSGCSGGSDGGQDLSRSDSVAACDGADTGALPVHALDARGRAVRPHQPDQASGRLGAIEHRRGVRAPEPCGLHQAPPDREGIAGRAVHADGTRHEHEHGPARCKAGELAQRGGTHPPVPDHESPAQSRPKLNPSLLPQSLLPSPFPLHLHTIPPNDPDVYTMICRADTIGVFQIESRAQMSMLPRLRPAEFYDLVIEVAIVRPGPIQGGMVHPYLRRRAGLEQPETLPLSVPEHVRRGVSEVLEKTLGVPLFQEQCMALAVKAAGFTPGEADRLRRAMAAWKRKGDQIYRFGRKLIDGMTRNNIPAEFAERCFEQIKGFSEYGFPESHAASFALLVYASAWLKHHHPAEFCAALLNSQPMGFYAPAQLVRDAREHGVEVRPVDANHSDWDCTVEPDGALRLGIRMVSGVGKADGEKIPAAVGAHGPFRTLASLWRASGVAARTLRRLAAADAFGSMGLSRPLALWHARALRDDRLPLFDAARDEPGDHAALPPLDPRRQVVLDYDSIGLSLKAHPVSFARPRLTDLGVAPCANLRDPARSPDGEWIAVAGLVLVRQRPGTAEGVTFMTLEDETGIANLVVWRRVYQKHRRAASARLVVARGRVQRQGEVVHVVVAHLRAVEELAAELTVRSRNFH